MDFVAAKDYAFKRLKSETSINHHYHNREHSFDVWLATVNLAAAESVTGDDLILLQTAAVFHDLGMLDKYFDHEDASVKITKSVLPDFKYSDEAIEKVCGLIMVTRLCATPHNLLERIICDADLDYLGRHDYFVISNSLRKEWDALNIKKYTDAEWLNYQVEFLEAHKYHTKSARTLRNPGKMQNLKKVNELLINT